MGNSCICSGQDTVVGHEMMDEMGPTDYNLMVKSSTCRKFPHRMLDPEVDPLGPTEATSSEAKATTSQSGKKHRTVKDLASIHGECLLFLERAVNVPYSDPIRDLTCQAVNSKAHGEPFIRAWAEDESGKMVGKVAQWPSKHCNTAPTWYTAASLGFPMGQEGVARLKLELRDQSALIGSLVVPYSDLPCHHLVHREFEISPPSAPLPGRTCSASFQVIDSQEVLGKRTVYFVRHGESSWNKAQSKLDLYEMGRQNDHPLSVKGREQAEALNALIDKGVDATLMKPDVVYVSPLTRAIQTAVIALRKVLDQPDGGHVVLMANAREKQNFGGFDSKPTALGTEVIKKTENELKVLYKGEQSGKDVMEGFKNLKFDTHEVEDVWWHNVAAESSAQVKGRLEEFMAQLKYSPHKNIVVVGHSHFFRAVFKEFLSDDFKAAQKDFAKDLGTMKLNNCGVAKLQLDPAISSGGFITNVELILGTTLEGDGGLCKCSGKQTRLNHDELKFEKPEVPPTAQ